MITHGGSHGGTTGTTVLYVVSLLKVNRAGDGGQALVSVLRLRVRGCGNAAEDNRMKVSVF